VDAIFDRIAASPSHLEYKIRVSFVEIYCERLRDLLVSDPRGHDNLQVGEDFGAHGLGVYIKGLTEYYVGSVDEVLALMQQGNANRATAATGMNAGSSRSHSLFMLSLDQKNTDTGTSTRAKLYLVDLAGSETVGKTGVTGQQFEELKKINQSLSCLGNVINALTDGKASHIPYRDSKLTRVLQECLGGNSKTALIINCSPSAWNENETLSTLRFGKRAKRIVNRAVANREKGAEEWKAVATVLEGGLKAMMTHVSDWIAFGSLPVHSGNGAASALVDRARQMLAQAHAALQLAQSEGDATAVALSASLSHSHVSTGAGAVADAGLESKTAEGADAAAAAANNMDSDMGGDDMDEDVESAPNRSDGGDGAAMAETLRQDRDPGAEDPEDDEAPGAQAQRIREQEEIIAGLNGDLDAQREQNGMLIALLQEAQGEIQAMRQGLRDASPRKGEAEGAGGEDGAEESDPEDEDELLGDSDGDADEAEGDHAMADEGAEQGSGERRRERKARRTLLRRLRHVRGELEEALQSASAANDRTTALSELLAEAQGELSHLRNEMEQHRQRELEEEEERRARSEAEAPRVAASVDKSADEAVAAALRDTSVTDSLKQQSAHAVHSPSPAAAASGPPIAVAESVAWEYQLRDPATARWVPATGHAADWSFWVGQRMQAASGSGVTEPSAWVCEGTGSVPALEAVSLPGETWTWTGDWAVNAAQAAAADRARGKQSISATLAASDSKDGWQFGASWTDLLANPSNAGASGTSPALALVRRRRWTRPRVHVNASGANHAAAASRIQTMFARLEAQEGLLLRLADELARRNDTIADYEHRLQSVMSQMADAATTGDLRYIGQATAHINDQQQPPTSPASARVVLGGGAGGVRQIRGGAAPSSPGNVVVVGGGGGRDKVASPSGDNSGVGSSFFRFIKRLSSSPGTVPPPGAAQRQTADSLPSPLRPVLGGGAGRESGPVAESQQAPAVDPAVAAYNATVNQLFRASEAGDLPVLTEILQSGRVSPNVEDKAGRTPLLYAARGGQLRAAMVLVNAGGDVRAVDKDGRNALHYSCRRGHAEVVRWLLNGKSGLSVHTTDAHALTPLHQATLGKAAVVIDLLLRQGADPLARDANGCSALKLARKFAADNSREGAETVAVLERWQQQQHNQ
jgi:hypothetical protein